MVDPFDDLDTEPLARRTRPGDRRRARRMSFTLPAQIDTKRRPRRFGMTRNVSRTGALLATSSRFRIGATALLQLVLADGLRGEPIRARVIRLEVNEEDPMGVWHYFVALRFVEPLAHLPAAS